ncbi:uncharacterized protein N7469_005802 [Penicillium citrinum]|uniref:Uncharacterized protein n=1 Tax=Penicillium citrinum TaxID=5077 RepID=A0A9W9TPD1_PENCI|nr:uncharacterized protein N7469_005802 [Penicillium citrinum]KAJ5234036.1 hypothetical protein N7469_005802 [Penicillium citrinum]
MILRGGEARPSKREAKKESRSQETGDVSGVDRWTVGPSSAQMCQTRQSDWCVGQGRNTAQ